MAQCIHWILYFLWKKKSSTTYELWTLSRRGTFDLRCHRNVNFDIFSHIYIWPVTQCLKTAKKVSFLRAKRATLISKKNLWWIVFAPCKFFQIISDPRYLQYKMTWYNLKKFLRGKNESPKVSKVTLLVTINDF